MVEGDDDRLQMFVSSWAASVARTRLTLSPYNVQHGRGESWLAWLCSLGMSASWLGRGGGSQPASPVPSFEQSLEGFLDLGF